MAKNNLPEYRQMYQEEQKRRKQQKYMEEKPFQFDIYEYIEQTKKPVINQIFLEAFYALPEGGQIQVMDGLGKCRSNSLRGGGGEDYASSPREVLRLKRIDAFFDQWFEEQTKEWVTSQVKRIKDDPTLPLGVKK